VKRLQEKKHIVGMTGDGVNDAPALKKADIGIAVDDATDAARGASDIVLTEPGLSVIISAVLTSRCIFQRMKNYTVSFVHRVLVLAVTLICVPFAMILTPFSMPSFESPDLRCFHHHPYCGKYLSPFFQRKYKCYFRSILTSINLCSLDSCLLL
jgi:hypothetical protein